MTTLTLYEFDTLLPESAHSATTEGVHLIPKPVYAWLEAQCLKDSAQGQTAWLRLSQHRGQRALQVTHFVGVIASPHGFQLEILPKVGKVLSGGASVARQLLLEMLACLPNLRALQSASAQLAAARMPLLEVVLSEYLNAVEHLLQRGLRRTYLKQQDNLLVLKGKLLTTQQWRHNTAHPERFYSEFDELSLDRPEHRLLHAALQQVLALSSAPTQQAQARTLALAFANVPVSPHYEQDFQRLQRDRSMQDYQTALAWARLILAAESPLTGLGVYTARSLLFPMEVVFEAFVAQQLAHQLAPTLSLKTQARSQHLVRHREQEWFRLQPDLLIQQQGNNVLVLDTKWKLLDDLKANSTEKYGLSQSDFYQLQAYGQSYLAGQGDVILIYPKTHAFHSPLPVFEFPHAAGLRLWVLPFCLKTKRLILPDAAPFATAFRQEQLH